MAFQNKYSSHVPHTSPPNPLWKGDMELSKKTSLPVGKEERKEIESSIVSKILKGVHKKLKVIFSQKHNILFGHHIPLHLCSVHFLPHP
jgi:hypothetical protein